MWDPGSLISQEQSLYLELLLTKNIPSSWLPSELEDGEAGLPLVKAHHLDEPPGCAVPMILPAPEPMNILPSLLSHLAFP